MKLKAKLFSGLTVLLTVLLAIFMSHITRADINYNNLIDDWTFENSTSMNAGQIDAFLNTFPNSCISMNANGNGNPGFRTADPLGWNGSSYSFGGNVTAGQAIYDTAQLYHVNPQVILATLQKEQSVVSGNAGCYYNEPDPGSAQQMTNMCGSGTLSCTKACTHAGGCMNIAMSYACPNYCKAADEGFSLQLTLGTWLLRFAEERSKGITTGYVGYESGDSSLGYSGAMVGVPYQLSDGNTVTVQSGATASLYYYTPFENGNTSFVNIFQSWFGPTTGQGYELVISSTCSSACPQYVVYGSIKQYVPSSQVKHAWGLPDQPLSMDPNVLNNFSSGPDLGFLGTLNTNSTKTLYFMDNAKRYRIPWPSMVNTWNFQGQVISDVSAGLFSLPADAGDLTNVVKNPANSTYYMLDGGNGGQTVLRPYANDTVRQAWEGTLDYTPISSDYFGLIDNAIGSTLSTTSASCNGTNFQVVAGQRYSESAAISALYPSIQSVSGATFNRLVPAGSMSSLIQSKTSPNIYLVYSGAKHLIPWPNAMSSWQASGQGVTQVNDAYLSNLSSGSSISSYLATDGTNYYMIDQGNKVPVPSALNTAYAHALSAITVDSNLLNIYPTASQATGFVISRSAPALYLLDNSGNLRHLPNPTVAGLWGAYQTGTTTFSDYIISAMTTAADAQLYVSDGVTNYAVDVGKKASVAAGVATDWGLSSPQTYSDGTLSRLSSTSALASKMNDGAGMYYYIKGGSAYVTSDSNIAGLWGLTGSSVHNGSLATYLTAVKGLTRFVKSSTDSRTFMIDSGNWYNLPSQLSSDYVASNDPSMTLDPANAPNSITDWPGTVVKDGSGNYYVVDNRTKRFLPMGVIRDQWTNNETTTDQQVSSYFLNLLASGSNMERAIKGSAPAIYSVQGETKRHILYPDTYNRLYAPYTNVSDQLVNALSSGADI